ncbi:2,5-didehydrogluconate reductase DkgB [Uliginosibacterium sp. sgz301328]|uniref:2,5-didehydrogluconate reductase DkgB n=1 Tax=Uliginosibacterium sp. sgz301328 TaxID=3243764 RepID=UPI00359E89D0
MQRRNNVIPSIGLGTFRLQGQAVVDSVRSGIALGYRHIDTAQIYGNEAEVGQAIAESGIKRDELFVTTKVWIDNLSHERLIPSLRESLDKMRMDKVDLALIHWPSPGDALPVEQYMTALAEARELGLTRLIGVSNFTIAHLDRAIDAVGASQIATQQVEVHPFLQNRKLIEHVQCKGIHVTAYMPLAYGKVMSDPVLLEIARRRGVSPAQVALAWSLQQGRAVIPSSTRPDNQRANLASSSVRLAEEDMAAITLLDRGERLASPDFAPDWD